MKGSIVIYRGQDKGGAYVAVFEDPVVIGLFGTNTLPTPFTDVTPPAAVELRLRNLNPNVVVRFGGKWNPALEQIPEEGTCLVCRCTDMRACVVEGALCSWVGPALCSACSPVNTPFPFVTSEPKDLPW